MDHRRIRDAARVKSFVVQTGYQKNDDIFAKNERVRQLRMMFSDGETNTLMLDVRMLFAAPVGETDQLGLLDQIHHRRCVARQPLRRHGDHEAACQFGSPA